MVEVAILDCSEDNEAYDNFSRVLDDTELYDVYELEFPDDPDSVIVTGSRYGVYEDLEWIDELLDRIQDYIEDDVPVLGVCFGHQAVAKALGGEVENMDDYEIGYRPVRLQEGSLFEELEDVEFPFSTHQDEIVSLPSEVVSTAESDVSVHGFEHEEKPVFGVQFHPEFDVEMIEGIIEDKPLSEDRKQKLMDEVTPENHDRAERTHHVLNRFVEISEQVT
jgi:GMP synthase (glutamine-hydrolysing)